MASTKETVVTALDRWVDGGLMSPEQAETLRDEVGRTTAAQQTRWSQYIIAATGAVVLLIASGAFVAWAWPVIDLPARVAVLFVAGLVVKFLGMRLEDRDRWVPASYLMQTAGLGILLAAVAYSSDAWPDATLGGIVVGILGLTVPVVTAWLSIRRNPIMPAVHAAVGYGFLALFLSRSLGLKGDEIVWVLDGVLLLSVLLLVVRIRAGAGDETSEWALNAFMASVYAGLVLVLLTSVGPLNLNDGAAIAADLWWLVVVGLLLWGIHRAPRALQRSWYHVQLGFTVLLGTGLLFWTADGILRLPDEGTAALVAALGVVSLTYGLPRGSRPVVVAACVNLAIAALYLGGQSAGALGVVIALAFTGGLLFWVSARLGKEQEPA